MRSLDLKVIPYEDGYKHREGNAAAHVKASLMGCSQHVIIKDGGLIVVNVPAGV